ncbi:LuxR family two component transcriptional regulator [Saccharopolyspora erythraea NRRL 2338]|uniref:Two component transcriptional regulator, LuxR family n=2 Tax=Saccharopolyspora erythraea TaxID=1836 RepID=A4FGK5_SACEN|nr:response regulator transcription factor [Saccharopolyspora erythraea]EQD83499.1 LuxR family transcriptional regulator [Saccharopolyspora erythraea D]PFG96883.1 LuxR family two component transcriptional regulator [Saccharopolyspora erythraea NRRL 2338]QRK87118.1 response regulator transcription factor [Saccharopolyspora erythraea]CAM03180.1 two component transcriptional regulator, LuxR family [Saccharopolyspora erythraea NRRL 2338]
MVDLVLGDDHAIFVDALVSALPENDFRVVGTASSIEDTLAAVRSHQPDVCLLDRYFADGDGLTVVEKITDGRTKVLVLTADGDVQGMRDALGRGATGYVNKMCGLSVLATAIRAVVDGEVVVELAASRAPKLRGTTDARRLASHLTARERQCLELLVEGAQTRAMARGLGVSSTTVRTHVQSVLTKLGVHSRLEAASFALRHSLLDQPPEPEVTRARTAVR